MEQIDVPVDPMLCPICLEPADPDEQVIEQPATGAFVHKRCYDEELEK